MLFENERATTVIERDGLQVAVVQIASRLVRQISVFLREGEPVALSQRLGVIRFGSQVDVVLPARSDVRITAKVGERLRAGESIIAVLEKAPVDGRPAARSSRAAKRSRNAGEGRHRHRRALPRPRPRAEPRPAGHSRLDPGARRGAAGVDVALQPPQFSVAERRRGRTAGLPVCVGRSASARRMGALSDQRRDDGARRASSRRAGGALSNDRAAVGRARPGVRQAADLPARRGHRASTLRGPSTREACDEVARLDVRVSGRPEAGVQAGGEPVHARQGVARRRPRHAAGAVRRGVRARRRGRRHDPGARSRRRRHAVLARRAVRGRPPARVGHRAAHAAVPDRLRPFELVCRNRGRAGRGGRGDAAAEGRCDTRASRKSSSSTTAATAATSCSTSIPASGRGMRSAAPPASTFRTCCGDRSTASAWTEVRGRPGVRWVRMSTDVAAAVSEMSRGRLSIREYARSLTPPVQFSTLAADDPAPGLLRLPLTAYSRVKGLLRTHQRQA